MHAGTIVLACLACACDARRVQTELGFHPNPVGAFQPRVATTASQTTDTLVAPKDRITVGPKMAGPKDIGSTKSIGQMLSGKASGSSVAYDTRSSVAVAPKLEGLLPAGNPWASYSIGPPESKIVSAKKPRDEILKGSEARPLWHPLDTINNWTPPTKELPVPRAATGPKDIGSTKSIGQMLSGKESGSSLAYETRSSVAVAPKPEGLLPAVAVAPKPEGLLPAVSPWASYSIGPPFQAKIVSAKKPRDEIMKGSEARPLWYPLDTINSWAPPTKERPVPRAAVGPKSFGVFSSDTPPDYLANGPTKLALAPSITVNEVLQ